jgi:(p)ppGpp synthase/HD superfamily hydrolase
VTPQEKQVLHGVDVSGSAFLSRPEVVAAADFAARAHAGQMRRTGDPYIMHCVETACIVEGLLSVSDYKEDDER